MIRNILFILGLLVVIFFSYDFSRYVWGLIIQKRCVYHRMIKFTTELRDGNKDYHVGVINIDDEDGIRIDYNVEPYGKYKCCWFSEKEIDFCIQNKTFRFIPFFVKPITYIRTRG